MPAAATCLKDVGRLTPAAGLLTARGEVGGGGRPGGGAMAGLLAGLALDGSPAGGKQRQQGQSVRNWAGWLGQQRRSSLTVNSLPALHCTAPLPLAAGLLLLLRFSFPASGAASGASPSMPSGPAQRQPQQRSANEFRELAALLHLPIKARYTAAYNLLCCICQAAGQLDPPALPLPATRGACAVILPMLSSTCRQHSDRSKE
jgi:hypothetical protein